MPETFPASTAPEVAFGLPYDTYARWDAVNHTVLRLFNRTPAHAREAMVNPPNQTKAQHFGRAVHAAILEPEKFEATWVPAPKHEKRTTAEKRAWARLQVEHPGEILPQEEYDLCLRMRDSVWAHPTAAEILKGDGRNEASFRWLDPETGVRCKLRLDRLTTLASWSVIVDLKTAKNASQVAFSRDLHKFHYHQQAAMYLEGVNVVAPRDRKFLFIVVEKAPPFCVAVYELEDDALEVGRDEYHKHLRTYAECMASGVWPGYDQGAGYVSLPSWAFKFHGEEA